MAPPLRENLPPVHEICSDGDDLVTYLCKLPVNAKMCVHFFLISKVARAALCSTYSSSFYTCAVSMRVFPWSLSEKAGRSIHFPRIGEGGVLGIFHRPVVSYTDVSNCLLIQLTTRQLNILPSSVESRILTGGTIISENSIVFPFSPVLLDVGTP